MNRRGRVRLSLRPFLAYSLFNQTNSLSLRRAKDKKRRDEKKRAERKEEAAEARGEGRKATDLKLAYRMAKWAGGEDGKLTQSQFSLKYSVCKEILKVDRKIFGGVTLSSSLVRGMMC